MTRGFTRAEEQYLASLAGVKLPGQSKFGNLRTYYDGRILHSRGRDCPPTIRCPVCLNPAVIDDREHWYPSRSEARFAARCDLDQKLGRIQAHARSPIIVLVSGATAQERVTYRPDRDVWITADRSGPPDVRYEVKGAQRMISQQGLLRIKMYRALAAEGKQPPLVVVNGDGEEIEIAVVRRRPRQPRQRRYTAPNMGRGPVTDAAHA